MDRFGQGRLVGVERRRFRHDRHPPAKQETLPGDGCAGGITRRRDPRGVRFFSLKMALPERYLMETQTGTLPIRPKNPSAVLP
jgi:hypothetical protein